MRGDVLAGPRVTIKGISGPLKIVEGPKRTPCAIEPETLYISICLSC